MIQKRRPARGGPSRLMIGNRLELAAPVRATHHGPAAVIARPTRTVIATAIGEARARIAAITGTVSSGVTAAIASTIRRIARGRSVFRGRRVAVVRHHEARALEGRTLIDDIERRRRRVDRGNPAIAAAAIIAAAI